MFVIVAARAGGFGSTRTVTHFVWRNKLQRDFK